MTDEFNIYKGDSKPVEGGLPKFTPFEKQVELKEANRKTEYYKAEEGLINAVNVAIALGQPLLLTGEPGTGKTTLADSIASALGLGKSLKFYTKSTSISRDLFYTYDSLGHFQASQVPGNDSHATTAKDFIHFQALGLAILLASDPQAASAYLPKHLLGQDPRRSIVLIDEIDKAPLDLPNDILHEIENMSFHVKELKVDFEVDRQYKPMVIFTSNNEKSFPEPFLRRCVYYHIDFPEKETLKEIIENKVPLSTAFREKMLDAALDHFHEIRERDLQKKPATAELLAWIHLLNQLGIDPSVSFLHQKEIIKKSYPTLVKSKDDLDLLKQNL